MFFGALSLAVSTAVTSCKDYDDDIDNLQTQIDANKASIADLQKFVNEGKWVKGVESVTGGFKITFSDGQSYTVVNGKDGAKGETGAQGVAGKDGSIVTIGEDGFWYIDGKKTDVKAQGEKGEKGDKGETGAAGAQGAAGKDGYSPYIGEDGFWYFYNAETQKVEKSKYQANIVGSEKTYIVENPTMPKYTLHTVTKDGKEVTLDLPTADNIQSVKAVKIAGTYVSENVLVGIKYNKLNSAVQFKGLNKEWNLKAGDILSTATEKISAIINPSNVDATTYKFYLQDSKGANELFVLGAPKANETSKPLARANTKNEGVYDFNISLKEGVTETQLGEFRNYTAFALATKNAWGNTIISTYDISVQLSQSDAVSIPSSVSYPYNAEKLNVGKAYDLCELFKAAGLDFSNIVDYNFKNEMPVSATVEGKMLTVNTPISLLGKIKMEYLAVDGTTDEVELYARFYNASEAAEVATPIKWVVPSFGSPDKAYEAVSSVDALKTYLAEPSRYSIVYADGTPLAATTTLPTSAFELAADPSTVVGTANGISLACAKNAKSGVWEMTAKFDAENIAPTTYTIHLGLKDNLALGSVGNVVQVFDLTIDVVENTYAFEPTNYLDNGKARVYGTFDAGKVTFDLKHLYKNLDLPNTTFKEVYKQGEDSWMITPDNKITVPATEKNIYKARNFEITYKPYGNGNFKKASQKFTVEILSEIHEGAHADFKDDKVFLSSKVRNVTIDPAKLGWTDYAGKKIALVSVGSTTKDPRLTTAEPTLTVSDSKLISATWNSSNELEVALTAEAKVTENLNVYVTVSVVDVWGITTTQKVMVPIKKAE